MTLAKLITIYSLNLGLFFVLLLTIWYLIGRKT